MLMRSSVHYVLERIIQALKSQDGSSTVSGKVNFTRPLSYWLARLKEVIHAETDKKRSCKLRDAGYVFVISFSTVLIEVQCSQLFALQFHDIHVLIRKTIFSGARYINAVISSSFISRRIDI